MGLTAKVKVNFKGLEKFSKQLNKLKKEDLQAFSEKSIKELAARLLAKVIKRTPVGKYPKSTGKKGGTLRRGWTAGNENISDKGNVIGVTRALKNINVTKADGVYTIEIINPTEYASYVEYGHRTKNGGWANGRFMLTISEQELEADAPKILEAKLDKFMGEIFNA